MSTAAFCKRQEAGNPAINPLSHFYIPYHRLLIHVTVITILSSLSPSIVPLSIT